MENKIEISSRLLDNILKDAKKKETLSIERYLHDNGYDKRMARGIRNKLIHDGYAVAFNDDEYSMRISTNGWLFINDGGYHRQMKKNTSHQQQHW